MTLFSQCIDKEKITYGGDWHSGYVDVCPTYEFAFNGDTSKNWNVLDDPIDIMQVAKVVMPLKSFVEQKIISYAGKNFFSRVRFNSVEIAYPQDIHKFIDTGRQDDFKKTCAAKYYFYYDFMPDSLMPYHMGIAVDESGKIISPFDFPSKTDYKLIDTNYSYCQLVAIARKMKNDIEPIKEIQFQYDKKMKRFYWLIIQEIKNEKEGLNYFYEVQIDAAKLTTKLIKANAYIVY
jgi:hypothetical protein